MPEVTEHTGALGDLPVFWRTAPAPKSEAPAGEATAFGDRAPVGESASPAGEARAPVLYVHGVPANSREWIPFLELTGGIAPDLPGFGRSGKPGHFDYTIPGYDRFLEQFLNMTRVERVRMVVHDWGAVGLAFAQRHPERVERLVVTNAVPFLPGYRWHRAARLWRTPVVGEVAIGATTRMLMKHATRQAKVTPGPLPDEWLDLVFDHFDQGTQRAILRLYRSAPSEMLERAGRRLDRLQMPTLVLWGMRDPYIPPRFAKAYANALPNANLIELPDGGHWWWYDRPDAIHTLVDFLGAR